MIKNVEIIKGIQEYERQLDALYKLENTRESTIVQARFKMAVVFDADTHYQMSKNQNMYRGEKWK
jgi:hypothetical protein